MANKQETKKRRVAAQKQAERQRAAAARRARRRQLILGGVIGFLVLALIAPLAFGLFLANDDEPAIEIPTTTTLAPLDFDWMPSSRAGVELTGPTPCPPTDGSAERTTGFEEAPTTCIGEGAAFELAFTTDGTSLTVPVDAAINPDAANLAAVFGWYHAYEETPIQAFSTGLIGIGGQGDAGFLIDPVPSGLPVEERFEPGAVLATTYDGGLNGALMVVVDETGQAVLEQIGADFVRVGTIDDLDDVNAAFAALSTAEVGELFLVDSVTVTETG
ncbi:MAG: hypothetical protein R8F63_16395 [Acidimicrobiales bacterium]|nr:hypothetical protein [Acidimicrobiales bacterium]